MHTAALPRWSDIHQKKDRAFKQVPIPDAVLSQLRTSYGLVAEWANSLTEYTVRDATYRCKPGGDANIGYITKGVVSEYVVGKIDEILDVKIEGGQQSRAVFLVRRHEAATNSFFEFVGDAVAHRALGLLVVSRKTHDVLDMVTMDQLIGHIAVNELSEDYGGLIFTIQLTKVCPSRGEFTAQLNDVEGRGEPPANSIRLNIVRYETVGTTISVGM